MKAAPYLFSGPNWLYGVFGGKVFPDENFAQVCLKSPLEFFFQKTHFRFEFLYEIAPHIFYGPNRLDGAIGGKSLPERRFVDPKKHVFDWNVLMKPALYLFYGLN